MIDRIWSDKYSYWYLFFLNLTSNVVFLFCSHYEHTNYAIISMFGCASLLALIESTLIRYISNRLLKRILYVSFVGTHSIIILVEYFLIWHFQLVGNTTTIGTLLETNSALVVNFVNTYLTKGSVATWIVITLAINCIFLWLSLIFTENTRQVIQDSIKRATAFVGLCVCCFFLYGIIRYRDGYEISQYIAPVRILNSYRLALQRSKDLRGLSELCRNVTARANSDVPNVVVVIGESFSKFHCPLYGYDKQTFPLLKKRSKTENFVLMSDAVCVADYTLQNMEEIFSLGFDKSDFTTTPLFPSVFKAAGYTTALYDNQYIVGSLSSLLSNESISSTNFDFRNNRDYEYDEGLIDVIEEMPSPYLCIIHLWGQHYQYVNRYPKEFDCFLPCDYDNNYDESRRVIMAQYDNANLYNDYVVDKIIDRYKLDDCIIVYLPDHGQEVYELGDYMGHGTVLTTENPKYQIEIPFMVWMSDAFMTKRPEVVERIKLSRDVPIQNRDISHFLIDVAGIECIEYDSSRSFINKNYQKRPRIIMNRLDYDQIKVKLKNM